MLLSHSIRLRGPWQCAPLARTVRLADGHSAVEPGELPSAGRVTLPGDWGELLGADFFGRVRYVRGFGLPSGLEPEQRLQLVIERADAFGTAQLNGVNLGNVGQEPARFDVTALLKTRNELVVEVENPRLTPQSAPLARAGRENLPGGLIGEVRLEILDNDDFLKAYELPYSP